MIGTAPCLFRTPENITNFWCSHHQNPMRIQGVNLREMKYLLHAALISAKRHGSWWLGHQKVVVFSGVRNRHGAVPIILSPSLPR